MKKAFKLFALAFLATSLTFVACSKDEDEDENTNQEQQEQQQQGGTTTTSVSYTFGGVAQTVGYYNGIYEADGDDLYVSIVTAGSVNGQNYTLPMLEMYWEQDAEGWGPDGLYFYQNMEDINAITAALEEEDPIADWQFDGLDANNTTLRWDAATKTITSASFPYTVWSVKEYILDDKDMNQCTKKALNVTITNLKLTLAR